MISVQNLTKRYGEVRALDGVSFDIAPGEVFGLLGPNGAGKTTTIKILTTLSKPDSGGCTMDGIDVVSTPGRVKPLFGVVPQENNLDRELTAAENLLIYGMLHRVKNLRDEIDRALEMVGLSERRDSRVITFSGGMQRRLLLARALMANPRVLFLDEPTIGLDPQIRRQIWDVIRASRFNGRTVVLTTHYIEEAEALCDRVGILSRGKMLALGSPKSLRRGIGSHVVEYIDGGGKLVQHLCPTRAKGLAMAREMSGSVTVRRSNLEDVFVRLTGERIE